MSVEIFVTRHGQDVDNYNGILNGHRDLPLTEIGVKQAHDLAEGIKASGLTFNAVYSSPLIRALETANIVCKTLGNKAQPVILPELIERDFGLETGKLAKEAIKEAGPNVIKTEGFTYLIDLDGGESFPQLLKRAHKALERVLSLQHEGSALLVCHGYIGKMIYAVAAEMPWEKALRDFYFDNGDLIKISSNGNAHKVRLIQHNLY